MMDIDESNATFIQHSLNNFNSFTSVDQYIVLTLLRQKCLVSDISAINTCIRKT